MAGDRAVQGKAGFGERVVFVIHSPRNEFLGIVQHQPLVVRVVRTVVELAGIFIQIEEKGR